MICLTGDVHHDSLKTNEQLFLRAARGRVSEVAAAAEYAELCEKHNVKCTLYTTGKVLASQWLTFKRAAESPVVEVGGHTYSGLPRGAFSRLRAALSGGISLSHRQSHGSFARQRRDVRRNLEIARQRLGSDLTAWRSHGLVRDEHTERILAGMGVRCISDELSWDKLLPERLPSGLISHAINVIMDHDHIYHAHRTREYVEKQRRCWPLQDDPTSESYTVGEWGELVERQVRVIQEQGGLATVLMHPLCMFVADGFETMTRLLEFFAQYETIWASEVGRAVPESVKEAQQ